MTTPISTVPDETIAKLRDRYTSRPVPPCRVCGAELSIATVGGGNATEYACADRPHEFRDRDDRRKVSEDHDAWYDHYGRSKWTQMRSGDSEVIAVLDELEALRAQHGPRPADPPASSAVVGLVTDLQGRVVIVRKAIREGHPLSGLWHLPGGRVEDGESDTEALLRELGEETGISDATVRAHLGSARMPDGGEVRWYRCFSIDPRLRPGDDTDAARLATVDELHALMCSNEAGIWPDGLRREVQALIVAARAWDAAPEAEALHG